MVLVDQPYATTRTRVSYQPSDHKVTSNCQLFSDVDLICRNTLPYKIDPYLKILKEKNEPDQGKQAWPRSLSWRRSTPGIDGRRVWSTTGSRDGSVDCFPAPITLFSSLNMCWCGTILFITPLFLQCQLRLFDEFWLQWVAGTTIFKDENDEWILHCQSAV